MAAEKKAQGNTLFKDKKWAEALALYEEGIKLCSKGQGDTGDDLWLLHKNAAACLLQLKKPQAARDHCDKVLDKNGGDIKARFRRSQAYEQEGNFEEAFKDMKIVTQLDPENKEAQTAAHRLMTQLAAKVKVKTSTAGIVAEIVDKALNGKDLTERRDAAHQIVALAKEEASAKQLFHEGDGLQRILSLLDVADEEIQGATLRAVAAIASGNHIRALRVMQMLSSPDQGPKIVAFLQSKVPQLAKACVAILGSCLESLAGVEGAGEGELRAIEVIVEHISRLIPSNQIISEARDGILAVLVKHAKHPSVAFPFLARRGVNKLLITASYATSPVAPQDAKPFALAVSKETKMSIAVALQHLFGACKKDKTKVEDFTQQCIDSISFTQDAIANIPHGTALTALLQGVVEVGNEVLEQEGVMTHLMNMAATDNPEAQCVAAEALAHAASDKKRARGVMMEGFGILKTLYSKEKSDAIRVRALTGLCKMAAIGGPSANMKAFSDGSNINLAKKLRPFLVDSGREFDQKRWAAEGLAYLTLEADVKEYIVHDKQILDAILSVCLSDDVSIVYSVANMLVNITNSFEKPENSEENEQLKKLGKFAGEYIPDPDPKDSDEYIHKRVDALVEAKFVTAMNNLAKNESENTREQVSRVLFSMVDDPKHRGVVVAQGGAKALLSLTRGNTPKGTNIAAQSLAKIAITANPSIAFPGQRAAELVKPLLKLSEQRNGLMQFEACMALCNLASVGDDLRRKIMREGGVRQIENLMFDEDILVRRAATEAMCNMFFCEEVYDLFAKPEGAHWERLKLWVLLSGVPDEDYATARAASGGLALLSNSPDVCRRIADEKQGIQILKELLICGKEELVTRALYIVANMVEQKELAEKLSKDEGIEIFAVVVHTTKDEKIKQSTIQVLEKLVSHGIIPNIEEAYRRAAEKAYRLKFEEELKKKQAQQNEGLDEEAEDEDEEEDEEEVIDAGSSIQELE